MKTRLARARLRPRPIGAPTATSHAAGVPFRPIRNLAVHAEVRTGLPKSEKADIRAKENARAFCSFSSCTAHEGRKPSTLTLSPWTLKDSSMCPLLFCTSDAAMSCFGDDAPTPRLVPRAIGLAGGPLSPILKADRDQEMRKPSQTAPDLTPRNSVPRVAVATVDGTGTRQVRRMHESICCRCDQLSPGLSAAILLFDSVAFGRLKP